MTVRSPFNLALRFNKNSVRAEGRSTSLQVIEAIMENKIETGVEEIRIFTAVADFKVKTSPTQLFLDTSPVIPNAELVNVQPLIKHLFSKEMFPKAVEIPSAGRISHFLVNWQKLTLNQDIPSLVKGYTIPFIKIPFQHKIPNFTTMNKKQIALVDLELKEMLKKGAIKRKQTVQGEILNNLFLVGKKRRRILPCNQSRDVEPVRSFSQFQIAWLPQA